MSDELSVTTLADIAMRQLEQLIALVEDLDEDSHELVCALYRAHDEALLLEARFGSSRAKDDTP